MEVSPRFLCPQARWLRACGVFLMIKLMVLVLVLLGVDSTLSDGVGFKNTCKVSEKRNVSSVLFQECMNGIIC